MKEILVPDLYRNPNLSYHSSLFKLLVQDPTLRIKITTFRTELITGKLFIVLVCYRYVLFDSELDNGTQKLQRFCFNL
jgi:hypothetical protein